MLLQSWQGAGRRAYRECSVEYVHANLRDEEYTNYTMSVMHPWGQLAPLWGIKLSPRLIGCIHHSISRRLSLSGFIFVTHPSSLYASAFCLSQTQAASQVPYVRAQMLENSNNNSLVRYFLFSASFLPTFKSESRVKKQSARLLI